MYIALTPEQEALRDQLRSYFADLMTPEVEDEIVSGNSGGPHCLELVRKLGKDGWLGLGWPTEYGGQGRSEEEQYVFINECWRGGVPIPFLTINTVAKTIMKFGTQEQKDFFLPKILAGELHFSIGYTEPNAGTDLASLTTKAVRDGDEWVINGQKIYTSLAAYADYIWLAARTDPDVPKHKGISIFAVPTSAPGFSFTPIHTLSPSGTTSTYYEDVRVPFDALIGEMNRGWDLIVNQLNYERVSLAPPGMIERHFADTVAWAKSERLPDGRRVIDQEWVQTSLARVAARVEFLKLLNWKVAWGLTTGAINPADASAMKVFGTELNLETYRALLEIVGQAGYLKRGSPGAVLAGRMERSYAGSLILTFGGGTNEIQRDIISMVGLGMPRAPR